MMRLLFTCMGTSDPVRGYHDGPMLHIIRHYRPEVICVFLSGEAAALDGCGARLDTVLSHIQNNWGGYAPELRVPPIGGLWWCARGETRRMCVWR